MPGSLTPVDQIIIKDLEVESHIGVTEAEQAHPQKLLITVELNLDLSAASRSDQESATTDYAAVISLILQTVAERRRKLLETVAHDITEAILSRRLALSVTVEVKKFSIPRTRYVAVRITRDQ